MIAVFIRETMILSAMARGLRGRVAVYELRVGRGFEYVIVIRIPSQAAINEKPRPLR